MVARADTIAISRPIGGILANVFCLCRKLVVARHEVIPVVKLPKMLAYVLDKAGATHFAVDVARAALETAHQETQMVLVVRGTIVNANQCMEMVRHQHRFKYLKLGIPLRQPLPIFQHPLSQVVQHDFLAHNRPEDQLVVRHLACHEKPPATVVDVCIPEGLAKQRLIVSITHFPPPSSPVRKRQNIAPY